MRKKLLIATNNPGKVSELKDLLGGAGFELFDLTSFPNVSEVAETGLTFAENARLKASGYAIQGGLTALADDSGLAVDSLGGRPGVLSARYGGEETGFDKKMSMLLAELLATGDTDRRASFVCSIALAAPDGTILFAAEGVCGGTLAHSPRGSSGFGYDPIFIPDGFEHTFGELDRSVKQEISHRSRAFLQIIPFLRHFNSG